MQLNEAYAISDVLMDLVILFLPVYEVRFWFCYISVPANEAYLDLEAMYAVGEPYCSALCTPVRSFVSFE